MNKELRNQISELLIKWGMPTRQAFINELLILINRERAKAFKEGATAMHKYLYDDTAFKNQLDSSVKDVVKEYLSKEKL